MPPKNIKDFFGPSVLGNEEKHKNNTDANPNIAENDATMAGAISQAVPLFGITAASMPSIAVSRANIKEPFESAADIQASCRERLPSRKLILLKSVIYLIHIELRWPNVNYHRLAVALATSLERGTMFVKPLKNARARQSGA